ncbi:hypothetical protein DFH06DRAFT_167214 [Mycena polygramma]|nr:hypothetical protein DFH06DRAFT_167214 [Mycena polygramma]
MNVGPVFFLNLLPFTTHTCRAHSHHLGPTGVARCGRLNNWNLSSMKCVGFSYFLAKALVRRQIPELAVPLQLVHPKFEPLLALPSLADRIPRNRRAHQQRVEPFAGFNKGPASSTCVPTCPTTRNSPT